MRKRIKQFNKWRCKTETQYKKHAFLARFWFCFGIFGLVEYLHYLTSNPDPLAFFPVAQSIPMLFFISVYANYASEKATAQALQVQLNQESDKRDREQADVV